jgi:hypothetical protein
LDQQLCRQFTPHFVVYVSYTDPEWAFGVCFTQHKHLSAREETQLA